MSNRKQSLLMGGLISSAGIFISKLLGLIYIVPFNTILQTAENGAYYSQSYNIYSYFLNVATAGLPFAIATLVARYATRNDYRTCLLVKKISLYTMTAFGFICMIVMMLSSGLIASAFTPTDGSVEIMRVVMILISFAVFIIPILSSFRGFFQGLGEMEIYSKSQVMEQIIRIMFLLTMGAIAVYVFNQDALWSVYFGVIAASVSGLLTIFYVRNKGSNRLNEIKQLAKEQELETKADPKVIFRELIFVAIPFLLISIFGYCDTIINQFDLKPGLEAFGKMPYNNELSYAIFYKATKIIAIPMILAPGFSAAIIPYITRALEKKNIKLVRRYILDCVESVAYISIPICLAICVFAQPILFSLFGSLAAKIDVPLLGGEISSLELETFVLKWYALEALCATICPIFSSVVTAIGFRRKIIINTAIFAGLKLISNRFLISMFGVAGMVLSSFIAYAVFAGLNVYLIQKHYHVNWKYSLRKLLFIGLGVVGFLLVGFIFNQIGWITNTDSRSLSFVYLAIMGLTSCGIYFAITAFCGVPQSIFHFEMKSVINKVIGVFKRK